MNLDYSRHPFLFHPVTLLFIEIATIVLVIGFTSPFSVVRPAALPLFVGCIWLVIPTCFERIPQTLWTTLFAVLSIAYLLHYTEVALLNRWSFEADSPSFSDDSSSRQAKRHRGTGGKGCIGTAGVRLRFGLLVAFSSRYVGTPYQVKYVPPFSATDAGYIPSRTKFLLGTARTMLLCYLVVDVLTTPGLLPEKNALLFSPETVPLLTRLGELSVEDILFRISSTFAYWITAYCVAQLLQGAFALVTVGTGLSEVKSWRPAFGPLAEAYTIRQFWG